LEEFGVPEDSSIADRTIGELRIGERTGAMILATRNKEGTFDTTPSANDRLRAGDTIVALGTREQITRLERLMHGEEVTQEK
jgi:K+/H+ antiporter YhaU regulatory subunit KhtT